MNKYVQEYLGRDKLLKRYLEKIRAGEREGRRTGGRRWQTGRQREQFSDWTSNEPASNTQTERVKTTLLVSTAAL